jgi:hypothetical protein
LGLDIGFAINCCCLNFRQALSNYNSGPASDNSFSVARAKTAFLLQSADVITNAQTL